MICIPLYDYNICDMEMCLFFQYIIILVILKKKLFCIQFVNVKADGNIMIVYFPFCLTLLNDLI